MIQPNSYGTFWMSFTFSAANILPPGRLVAVVHRFDEKQAEEHQTWRRPVTGDADFGQGISEHLQSC